MEKQTEIKIIELDWKRLHREREENNRAEHREAATLP